MIEIKMSPGTKLMIDDMDHITLARTWRFARSGSPVVTGEAGAYLKARLDALGGLTPELSKLLSR